MTSDHPNDVRPSQIVPVRIYFFKFTRSTPDRCVSPVSIQRYEVQIGSRTPCLHFSIHFLPIRGRGFDPSSYRLPNTGNLPSNYGRTSPPAKTILACEPSNGNLPSNHGRTSPPAKPILACEPINLCLRPMCAHTITLRARARARLRARGVTLSRRHVMSRRVNPQQSVT